MSYLGRKYPSVAKLLNNVNNASAKLYENAIEDMKVKNGMPQIAVSESGKTIDEYVPLDKLTNNQIKTLLLSYNEMIKEYNIQAPLVKTSYLKNKSELLGNLRYTMKKVTRDDKGAKTVFRKYTDMSASDYDSLSIKEKMTASALFDLANEYHLLDRASQYYDTETIKSIYEVAMDKRYSRLTIDDYKDELIEMLYDKDIINEGMYNSMNAGERVSAPLSSADLELLGF